MHWLCSRFTKNSWVPTWVLTLLGYALLPGGMEGAEPQRPNIIVILADDLGYGDPRCYNPESKVPTPNIDRLASEGIRFTDAHTPSTVCTPTRYGLLTGRYCWRSRLKRGVLDGYSPLLIEPQRMTVASLLKADGYRTACAGKWHLGLGNIEPTDFGKPLAPGPNAVGFDNFYGIAASLDMPPYAWIDDQRITAPLIERTAGSPHNREGRFWRPGKVAAGFRHEDVLPQLTAKAVSVIEETAKEANRKPLFLYVPLTAPHTPWLPTDEFHDRSKAGHYGDFVAQVDATVGVITDAVKRSGMADNTLLIFTSDNGAHWTPKQIAQTGHRANGPWRGQKADIWEGGHRVPLIARWPGEIRAGTTCSQTVCLTDLLATCADIVGSKLPDNAGEDSVSILPALRNPAADKPLREAVVMHSIDGMFAIRQGDWKLILGVGSGGFTPNPDKKPQPGAPPGQLYNLAKDPGETTNVYGEHPNEVERLTALLTKYQQSGRSRALSNSPQPKSGPK